MHAERAFRVNPVACLPGFSIERHIRSGFRGFSLKKSPQSPLVLFLSHTSVLFCCKCGSPITKAHRAVELICVFRHDSQFISLTQTVKDPKHGHDNIQGGSLNKYSSVRAWVGYVNHSHALREYSAFF